MTPVTGSPRRWRRTFSAAILAAAGRTPATMPSVRGAQDVGQVEEGVVGRERLAAARFVPPGVDARAELRMRGEVRVERLLVDDRAAGDVDEDCRRLHEGQFALAEQAAGGIGQRQ